MFEESFRIIQKWQICSEAYCKVSIISHLTLSAVFEMIVEKNTVMIKAAHVGNLKFQEFHNFHFEEISLE